MLSRSACIVRPLARPIFSRRSVSSSRNIRSIAASERCRLRRDIFFGATNPTMVAAVSVDQMTGGSGRRCGIGRGGLPVGFRSV